MLVAAVLVSCAPTVLERAPDPPEPALPTEGTAVIDPTPAEAGEPEIPERLPLPPPKVDFFAGSFEEAQAFASAQGKPMMVEAGADWCLPCDAMARYTFQDDLVAFELNEHFVSWRLDMSTWAFDALLVAQNLAIRHYPTVLFLAPDGAERRRLVGFQGPRAISEAARSVRGSH